MYMDQADSLRLLHWFRVILLGSTCKNKIKVHILKFIYLNLFFW